MLDHQQVVVYLDSIDKRLLDDSARMTGSTAPHFPRKATGGRAPSINIGAGHSALERLLEILSNVCGGRSAPTGASRPVVMGHDRLVTDFRVVYLDSIDERLPEDL